MRCLTLAILVANLTATLEAADAPLAEKYLHAGQLAKGEQELEVALAATPEDEQLRFGLGILQFVRGVERFGQSLHEYGIKQAENDSTLFLRLPVPVNADPAPIHYTAFRRVLDDFIRDLSGAEATLAGVTDDDVKLPLRLAEIHLDLDSDGKPTDKFIDILKKMMRQEFGFLKANPDFLVCFDRGDVAWLRAYCHLLTGILDCYLAFDSEESFNLSADRLFAKPKIRLSEDAKRKLSEEEYVVEVKEPVRLGRARIHFIQVAVLNHETWKFIRAERDDDREWLPNPTQKGVLGLPVRNNMIDAWLAMMTELKLLLEGERTFPRVFSGFDRNGRGLNLKILFDDPPKRFVPNGEFPQNLPDKYFSEGRDLNFRVLFRVWEVLQDTTSFGYGYAAWFN